MGVDEAGRAARLAWCPKAPPSASGPDRPGRKWKHPADDQVRVVGHLEMVDVLRTRRRCERTSPLPVALSFVRARIPQLAFGPLRARQSPPEAHTKVVAERQTIGAARGPRLAGSAVASTGGVASTIRGRPRGVRPR